MKYHKHKTGTPNLGGILIWLTVPAVLLLLFGAVPFAKAVAYIFLLLGAFGFIEKSIDMYNKRNADFRRYTETLAWRLGKLFVAFLVNFGVAYFIINVAGIRQTQFLGITLLLDSVLGYILVAFASLVCMYSVEIIDGLDALSTGMFIITLSGFIILALAFPNFTVLAASTNILSVVGIVVGVLCVYLYFNIPPARVFMGPPGTMPIGALILLLALTLNALPVLAIFMLVYLVDLASSVAQIISIRFFKRKIFRIAPLHHHFEAIGWPDYKVVMRFWLFNGVCVMVGILLQLFLNS